MTDSVREQNGFIVTQNEMKGDKVKLLGYEVKRCICGNHTHHYFYNSPFTNLMNFLNFVS